MGSYSKDVYSLNFDQIQLQVPVAPEQVHISLALSVYDFDARCNAARLTNKHEQSYSFLTVLKINTA